MIRLLFLALFLLPSLAFGHPQNAKAVGLDANWLGWGASGYPVDTSIPYAAVDERDGVCTVRYAFYDYDGKFFYDLPIALDENKQFTLTGVEGHWRLTLIERPEDLARTNVELAHIVPINGCYIVWEELH